MGVELVMKSHAPAPKPNTSFESTPLHLKAASAVHSTGSSSGSIVRTIIALAIVIAIIYALTWVVRKLKAGGQATAAASGDGLASIASLPLGANSSAQNFTCWGSPTTASHRSPPTARTRHLHSGCRSQRRPASRGGARPALRHV
jgi:hypothetical protein